MPTRTLSEDDSARIVERFGIPVVPHRRAADPGAAVAAADALGYPVVLKLHGETIAHKSERGLVRLHLRDADAVAVAAEELLAAAEVSDGPTDLMVAPVVSGSRELVAGMHLDAQFGRCVMVGIGGVLTEAIGDVAFRLAPLERRDALEMIDDLAHQLLLGAVRGEPALDRDAMADVLLALSDLATSESTVVSVDLNPMIVVAGRPLAVDALVEVAA